MSKYSIPRDWDTGGEINAESDPQEEFWIWRQHVSQDRAWSGNEFTLQDFEDYISSLRP